MTNDEVKKYLKQVRYLQRSIRAKQEKIRQLREQTESITITMTDDVVQGGAINNSSFAEAINAIIDLQNKIAVDVYREAKTTDEIMQKIKNMSKDYETLAEILSLYYVNGLTWEKVCIESNYSWIHVHRLHGQALHVFKNYM